MQQELNTSFSDVLRFLRRGLLLALLVSLISGAAAFIVSTRLPSSYRAEAVIVASRSSEFGTAGGGYLASPLDVQVYRTVAESEPVLIAAMQNSGMAEPSQREVEQFREKVNITISSTGSWQELSSLIKIAYTSPSREEAALVANELSGALVTWDKNRAREDLTNAVNQIGQQVTNLRQQIVALQAQNASQEQINNLIADLSDRQDRLYNLQALLDTASSYLTVIRPAVPPLDQVAPRPVFNTALAILLGVIFSYGILLLRAALDTRLRDVDDLAAVSGLPVLASFPKLPSDTRRLPNEAISYLRTNLLFSMAEAQPKVILVTSSSASEGKSSVSLSLAESFVRNNYRTLLVDADLRKPVIAGEYRISADRKVTPLERWLRNPYGPNQPAIIPIGGRYTLNVIPSFEPTAQAAELLSAGFRESLDSWRKEYDVIIIDSAPVLAVADTLTIAPLCTGTLLVANQQKTDRRQIRAMVELLKRIGVRMTGVVATHVSREASQGTGYGYGYGNIDENELKKTIIPEAVTATKLTNSGR